MKEVERIANTNLMPSYLKRKQFIADSTRAYFYFNLRKDSSYIRKYLRGYTNNEKKPAQKITGSFTYANAVPGKEAIHTKQPARKREEALDINDNKHQKNQEIR